MGVSLRSVGVLFGVWLSIASATPSLGASTEFPGKARLVLVLVIDQFRADYLTRFKDKFRPDGLRLLMSKGAYYPYAEYDVLQCMTGPGHATILSGSYMYQAGIPLNDWIDPVRGQPVYCVEDPSHKTVGADNGDTHIGTSPRNFTGSTVGDELKNVGRPSRVVTIALKDRAAILLGGARGDLAVWWDKPAKRWVSSTYYLKDNKLPAWVSGLNTQIAGRPKAPDIKSAEGIEITEQAAEAALDALKLGQNKDGAPDLLAVSFSSHDYAGHEYGPTSPQMERMTLADDRAVASLLGAIKKKVPGGLANVVVVFTADHGIQPTPAEIAVDRVPVPQVSDDKIVADLNALLDEKLGKAKGGKKWVLGGFDLNFFLNHGLIQEEGLPLEAVESAVKQRLEAHPAAAAVFTASEWRARRLPPGLWERQILKTYVPGRSGDVVMIPKPFTRVEGATANHMTGYTYDRMVPLIFMGPGVRPGVYARKAEVVDLAPTLSFLLGVMPPALSEGRVLWEAVER